MNIAVVFAAGTGVRMNSRSRPKQFLEVHGKPVLAYTLEIFSHHPQVEAIVLVCLADWMGYVREMLEKFHIQKVLDVVPGGATGQESIRCGLEAARCHTKGAEDIVLIHDGVRPMLDEATISACIESVKAHGSAITVTGATETMFVADHGDVVGEILPRTQCALGRAPQCFYLQEIAAAYQRAREEGASFIDSASMMQHYGKTLRLVEGPVENIKITTPTDFYLFRALLDARENMQIIGL